MRPITVLKGLRLCCGKSQTEVALLLGLKPQVLSGIENRRLPLFPKYLEKLMDFYEVTESEISDEDAFAKVLLGDGEHGKFTQY